MDIIKHIIENMEVCGTNLNRDPLPDSDYGYLSIIGLHNFIEELGDDIHKAFRVKVTEELKDYIENEASMIYPIIKGKNAGDDYTIQIYKRPENTPMMKIEYQYILGSRSVGEITKRQLSRFKSKEEGLVSKIRSRLQG